MSGGATEPDGGQAMEPAGAAPRPQRGGGGTNAPDAMREVLRLERLKLEQTEAALWQYAYLIDMLALPIVVFDRAGRVTEINAHASEIYRWERSDVLGRRIHELVDASIHARVDDVIARCCERGERVENVVGEIASAHDFGTLRTMLLPMRDRHGDTIGMILTENVGELRAQGELLKTVNDELRELTLVDGLTQLANRRQFERVFARETGRAIRGGMPLGVLMVDIDRFKDFNDSLGHHAGDAGLRRVAAAIDASVQRPTDLVARWGGEEFVVVLPDTDVAGVRVIADRIRARVEAERIERPDVDGASWLTVSVGGAASVVRSDADARALLEAADRRLFDAKRSGRNRTAIG